MIKTRMGTTEFKGNYAEIMADYTMITCSVLDFLEDKMGMGEDVAIEILTESFEAGIQNKKEMDEAMKKFDGCISDMITDLLRKTVCDVMGIKEKDGEK